MIPHSRAEIFSPNPTAQPIYTGASHSPYYLHGGVLSAAASPKTSSPTGPSPLTKIIVAQVYLLLSTIKYDRGDSRKWDGQVESLRKLIDENGMEVYSRFLTRLIVANTAQIFPGSSCASRAGSGVNAGSPHILLSEMRKISIDFGHARKVAESIEGGTEDIFRDFDLSTFMEHFKLDALEKTLLALAFKLGHRSDLKTKADAILSTNFPTFINILSRPNGDHTNLSPDFVAELIDRFIQIHPPNFNAAAKKELQHKVLNRYSAVPEAKPPPAEVLAALDLVRLLGDKPPSALALYIHRTGSDFTSDENTCIGYLQNRPLTVQLSEEQVSLALSYTAISQTPKYNPSILVAALRRVLPVNFKWQNVVSYFDHSTSRVTSKQFLRLYRALEPIAREDEAGFQIQSLWGGEWEDTEAQLSFICAFLSLRPDELDASTIPGLVPTFTVEEYAGTKPTIREFAAFAVRHSLVSRAALRAIFDVALHSTRASQSTEAKRLFQDVVVPNLPIFVVSAFGVPKPWPSMADETLGSLLDGFLGTAEHAAFVLHSLWTRDKEWVMQKLSDHHAANPTRLPFILQRVMSHGWLEELVYSPTGFALDLAALAHAQNHLDLQLWGRRHSELGTDLANILLRFLMIKADFELQYQRSQGDEPTTTPLHVRTVAALLQILEDFMPKTPFPDLIIVQRHCITAYPRLINYGEGYDDVIDANGKDGNALPPAAVAKMEEHYKRMYGDEIEVKDIVSVLDKYKHSRDLLDQDVFACMIHGLFDEYTHYVDYPLEALATTAVLFGGIISHKLISDLPLQIGLGMILEAIRDYPQGEQMYKFGLQALMQLFSRLREWPGFCKQLLQIPGLQSTEAWKKADDVVREHDQEVARHRNGTPGVEPLANGALLDDALAGEPQAPPFASINVDPPAPGSYFEDPNGDIQGRIQFVLNNLTDTTLQSMFQDLREMLEERHQQWFVSHLVEERAKMQPNYHQVYLDLVKRFEDKALWSEVLRETYISVARMLNSEVTLQNPTDRAHLKNLGGWLGLLTLARDKPIKQKNIAFKQLLIEAHDTKRLIAVIPFVCKVLIQGASSNVFRPPNPWLMDIIYLLIELYHNAELKLNLKFEIEVLCKGLSLDHTSIEPSGEILNRIMPADEVGDMVHMNSFDTLSVNGMSADVGSALSPHVAPPPIPDLGPNLSLPSTEVVTPARLHEIVRKALTCALQDIIQPVVDRSVTIAAISTQQMIHKDFSTEPDENRVRTAAINMVKSTAGSLALVTSKEPLRANFTNYMRNLSNDLPQGLPEGIIIMCVNSNLDLASSVIEKSAQDRAVPEIEEMMQDEMQKRRMFRQEHPNDNFMDTSLNRWALTIPNPYKLQPNPHGLNAEQMAIYDDFARQPMTTAATAATATPSHAQTPSNATNSVPNDVLQDAYTVAGMATPNEAPSMPQLGYPQALANVMTNGRPAASVQQMDVRGLAERVTKLLEELERAARGAQEEHFNDLPRELPQHPVLAIIDALTQLVIKTHQSSPEFPLWAAERILGMLLNQLDDTLAVESLVHVLETLRKIAGPAVSTQIRSMFHQRPGDEFLTLPLLAALVNTDLIDWRNIDSAMSAALQSRKEGSIEFFGHILDLALFSDTPLALFADFVSSLEEAWTWIVLDPNVPGGQQFKGKLLAPHQLHPANSSSAHVESNRLEQMEYVFEEWIHLFNHPGTSDRILHVFLHQISAQGVIRDKDDFFVFMRQAIDKALDRYEHVTHLGLCTVSESFRPIDALAKMVIIYLKSLENTDESEGRSQQASFMNSVLGMMALVLNFHILKRADASCQRPFFRLFSTLLHEIDCLAQAEQLSEYDREQILLQFAARFNDLSPPRYPGFVYGWLPLISHRSFLPKLMQVSDNQGWAPYTRLLKQMLLYLGELLKPLELSILGKDTYNAVVKLLLVVQHDYPEFMSANHLQLVGCLPAHATQLINIILSAIPRSFGIMPDPTNPDLSIDMIPEIREMPASSSNHAAYLRQLGLLAIVDQTLRAGPSEDAIAQIRHAICTTDSEDTGWGFVPIGVSRPTIDAVIGYIATVAIVKADSKKDASVFVPGSYDAQTLHMLVAELSHEARYYMLSAMVNHLRYANANTKYFSQALFDMFVHDLADPEANEVRQQIVRVILERLLSFGPHPWGLMLTAVDLVRSEKYHFFELPFIKASPEVAQQVASMLSQRRSQT